LRARGVKVWNGGALADALEKDRSFGMKAFEKAGIPTPETFKFGTASQAKEIVSANFRARDRMVIKLDDFGACATSYVARDRADMLAQIATWEADPTIARIDKGGIIQRFVEGVEISIEGWFNGTEFMYPFNVKSDSHLFVNYGILHGMLMIGARMELHALPAVALTAVGPSALVRVMYNKTATNAVVGAMEAAGNAGRVLTDAEIAQIARGVRLAFQTKRAVEEAK